MQWQMKSFLQVILFLGDLKGIFFLMKLRIIVCTSLYASLSFVKAVKVFVSKNY